jgi:hypothetical protein
VPAAGAVPTEPGALAITNEGKILVVDRDDNRVVSFELGV